MSGPVDMSVYNGTLAQLWALAGGSPAAPVAPPAPKPVPSAPVSLAATPGAGTVTLTWAPPIVTGGGLTAYTVTVSGRPAQRLPATATSFTATGLKPAALQSFTVAAVNANGTGPLVTTAAVPLVPTRVALTPSVATVNSGARHQVVAAVTRTDTGAAIAGSPVTVHVVARAGASPAPYAVTTDAAGRATISVTPAATSDITVSLPQSATLWTSAAAATVAVAPSLTVALSAASVRAGGIVTLSGTTGRENAGQTAVTQWYDRGKWFTGVGMKVAANGTFSVRVRPMKKMTLTYRLVLGATAGHNAAISRTVVLKVV
jgi:hypothetical protein